MIHPWISVLFLCSLLPSAFSPLAHADFPSPSKIYQPHVDTGYEDYAPSSLFHKKKIVLTFDDGPDAVNTPVLLDILKSFNVKATFFIVGQQVTAETAPLIKRMLAEGHLIGAHSMHHLHSDLFTEEQFKADTHQVLDLLANLRQKFQLPQNEIYYRFPYGEYGENDDYHHFNVLRDLSKQVYGDNCINFVFWNIDTLDWLAEMSPKDVMTNVFSQFDGGSAWGLSTDGEHKIPITIPVQDATQGGVILMHDVHRTSIDALPTILTRFQERGIEVVPLNTVENFKFDGLKCGLR